MQSNEHSSNHPIRIRKSDHELDIEKHSEVVEDEDGGVEEDSWNHRRSHSSLNNPSLGRLPERADPTMMHDRR